MRIYIGLISYSSTIDTLLLYNSTIIGKYGTYHNTVVRQMMRSLFSRVMIIRTYGISSTYSSREFSVGGSAFWREVLERPRQCSKNCDNIIYYFPSHFPEKNNTSFSFRNEYHTRDVKRSLSIAFLLLYSVGIQQTTNNLSSSIILVAMPT